MPARPSTRVTRTFAVRGGNDVTIVVKVVREGASYIACDETRGLKARKKAFAIRKGATLIRRRDLDRDGLEYVMIFNEGIYEAIRSQGMHVPDGYGAEDEKIRLFRGSLAFALQGIWYMASPPTVLQVGEYRDAVESVGIPLAKARDRDKVRAGSQSRRAADLNDRRGIHNRFSRAPIVWSADLALGRRTKATRRIRPRVAWKHWELVALADEAWDAKTKFEAEIVEALRWWEPGVARLDQEVADRMATRFTKLSGSLRSVSVAPYSRRGFPRIATDLDRAIVALRAGDFQRAEKMLRKCKRAFLMMDARRPLEEACTIASRVAKKRVALSKAEVDDLVDLLDRVELMLCPDGVPIDADFDHPVIAERVLPMLADARRAALHVNGYQAKAAFRALKAAPAPL